MALILSLETATTNCSVAIHLDGKLLTMVTTEKERSHAEKILLLIEEALEVVSYTLKDLHAIAISAGPGSYTGLRIASSTAKGLCFALDIPLIAVNTLEAIALSFQRKDHLVCAMLDARRMEVYCAIYDEFGKELMPVNAKIIYENSFQEFAKDKPIVFCGDAVEKCKDVIKLPNAVFMENDFPNADQIGKKAALLFETKTFADTAYFEPFYLKEFIALTSSKPIF